MPAEEMEGPSLQGWIVDEKTVDIASCRKQSPLGAGIPGCGLGIWLADDMRACQWGFVIQGAILHVFGMIVMYRYGDQRRQLSKGWRWVFQLLFWLCTVFIVVILIRVSFL